MTKPIPQESTIFTPASRADDQLTELLDLRLGKPTRQERAAIWRGDWVAVTDCAPEGAKLPELHRRTVARRWV